MLTQAIEKEKINAIASFLSRLDLFKKLPTGALEELANKMVYVYLGGGETLIQQGDTDSSLYILFNGRLRVYQHGEYEKLIPISEIAHGQIVGEIAFLTKQPRTATVRAIRDSIILKLEADQFQQFESQNPEFMLEIAKTAITRLTTKKRPLEAREMVSTLAIAPSGNSDHISFLQSLVEELNKTTSTCVVNAEICNRHFGAQVAQIGFHDSDSHKINQWLISLENQYKYVIYETDKEMTPWSERCLRQADSVMLVAKHSSDVDLNPIEQFLFSRTIENSPPIDMIFMHNGDHDTIQGTHQWLKLRPVQGYHHIIDSSPSDYARLIRFLTGQAFGVVLSGGGVRGFAHAGVLRALEELNIPIDFIGGTSMGAAVAGIYAKGGIKNLLEFCTHEELENMGKDYTLPIVSLLKGKNASRFLKKIFGNSYIEDLKTHFFCVSANVTQSKLHIHEKGTLWLAVRASTALPAIYPPIYDEEHNMIVDGGIINNMPVDVMRKMLGGGKILAVNCYLREKEAMKGSIKSPWISGWQLFFQKLNPFSKKRRVYNNIFNILRASFFLSSEDQQELMGQEADYLLEFDTSKYSLLKFEDRKEIIDLGYKLTLEKLPRMLLEEEKQTPIFSNPL